MQSYTSLYVHAHARPHGNTYAYTSNVTRADRGAPGTKRGSSGALDEQQSATDREGGEAEIRGKRGAREEETDRGAERERQREGARGSALSHGAVTSSK